MYLDSTAVQQLLRFVKNGNTALICSKTIPTELMRFVAEEDCIDSSWADYQAFDDTIAHLRVEQPRRVDFDLSFVRRNKTEGYAWSYLPASDCCTEVLGSVNDSLVCFARFPYGKGRFLLHTIPLALSNYQLLRPEGQAYAEALLSWLTEGDIYWDASSKVPEDVARLQNSGDSERPPEEHLLSFVLQQPALAWSWYLLLALALVYLLFRAKRRQRVIPVLPWNENSSYEFISTIANLHYREKNYRNLSRQMMKQFLLQVRDRYGMPVPLEQANGHIRPEPAYMEQLARITELPQEKIQHIFTLYANCIQYEPNEQMAIDLHLAIEGVKI